MRDNQAYKVYCDMNSCGNDCASGGHYNWGDGRENYRDCGGWAMIMKTVGVDAGENSKNEITGRYFLNRMNTDQWRDGKEIGDCTNLDKKNCLGPAYSRHKFTDVCGYQRTRTRSMHVPRNSCTHLHF